MNKIILALVLSLFAVSTMFGQATNAPAQPSDNTTAKNNVLTFYQNIESNRSVTIAVFPSYAPSIVVNGKKDTFGFGLAVLTPASAISSLNGTAIGDHAFAGLRLDYLAHQAFASTVAVGLKGSVQIWGHNFDGFAQSGANFPFSGFGVHNGEIGAMVGSGGYTDLYHFSSNAVLGIQIDAEKWVQFKGGVFHGGPVFTWKF